jgi:ABC-type nitrate/sulfonate/bicarbonate transport system permease component
VFALALALWQTICALGVFSKSAIPTMTSTVAALGREATSSYLWSAVGETLEGWSLGMLIGSGAAIAIGMLLGSNRFAYKSAAPLVEFLKTVPAIAILPLVIIVFGATMKMKVFLVAFAIVWQLTIQVMYGVRAVDPVVRDTANVLRIRGLRRVITVTIPSAAPFIATGLRVSAATGLILAVGAGLVGGAPGLGLNILVAENAGPTVLPSMYAFILVTGMVGVVLTGAFTLLEQRLLHWHESQRNRASGARAV